ncbi:MAG: hypothetical protein QUU85_10935 [Candidatus Eisenbacteria bacterium]|nr:hypothetical protein [Candidatus Eisenbacteria bacterium]
MSTFVIRFFQSDAESFRGRARHVRSGEETSFSSRSELWSFLERMNASGRADPDRESTADRDPGAAPAGGSGIPTAELGGAR